MTEYKIEDYPESAKWGNGLSYEEFRKIDDPISEKQKALVESAIKDGKRFLWIGDHDCREGIITTIKAMFENGKFFPVWHDCPMSWITNYMEHRDGNNSYPFTDFYEKTKLRISRMPAAVQSCINGTYRQ